MHNDDLMQQQSTINPNPPMSMPIPMPAPPEPALQSPAMHSPIMNAMPMQPMPASVMSPDQMLRAYAEQRRTVASPPPVGAPILPAPTFNGSSMRTLYAPDNRQSLSPTEHSNYLEEDVYGGTAQ